MGKEQFFELIKKSEISSKNNPKKYRNKVLFWVFLGYAVFFGALILALSLLAVSVIELITQGFKFGLLKLLIFILPLSFFLLRALIVKKYKPAGIVLTKDDAPKLFQTLEELAVAMKAPRFDTVILDHQWNASVVSVSKTALPGFKRRHILHIGLPLLISLDDQQIKAILAHEISHISESDTTLGAKVYRLEAQWGQLMNSIKDDDDFTQKLFSKFLNWYYPRFLAFTFVLRRQEEYIADANAAKATSNQTAAEALILIHTVGSYLYEELIPKALEQAEKNQEEPKPLSNLYQFISNFDSTAVQSYLNEELKVETQYHNSHPSLADRLQALQAPADLSIPVPKNRAVDIYLKNGTEWVSKVEELLNTIQITGEVENFEETYQKVKEYRLEVQKNQEEAEQEYQTLLEKSEKTVKEHYQFFRLTYALKGPEAAILVLQGIIESLDDPEDYAHAYLHLGQIYLQLGNEKKAEEMLEKAGETFYELKATAYETLIEYYNEMENEKRSSYYDRKLEKWIEILGLSDEECEEDYESDEPLLPHRLNKETLHLIRQDARQRQEIASIYIARRELEYVPQRKCYLIVIEPVKKLNKKEDKELIKWAEERMVQWVGDESCSFYFFDDKELLEPYEKAEGVSVYQKSTQLV